jgi:hypothetical protein
MYHLDELLAEVKRLGAALAPMYPHVAEDGTMVYPCQSMRYEELVQRGEAYCQEHPADTNAAQQLERCRLLLDKWRADPADRQHWSAVAQAEAAYDAARERWERAYLQQEAWEEQRQAARERGECAVRMVMVEEVESCN